MLYKNKKIFDLYSKQSNIVYSQEIKNQRKKILKKNHKISHF